MVLRELRNRARQQAATILGDALEHRREHPLEYAIFHAEAATYFRKAAESSRRQRKRARARWQDFMAMIHRQRRRHFTRKARASAEAEKCECTLQKLEQM